MINLYIDTLRKLMEKRALNDAKIEFIEDLIKHHDNEKNVDSFEVRLYDNSKQLIRVIRSDSL